jgi:hypothetical protein
MSEFIYPVNFYSQKKEINFKQLSYADYKNFNKVIINKDVNCISFFINNLIESLCLNKSEINRLIVLDKLYILLFLYGTNLSSIVQLTFECPIKKKKFTYHLNLAQVLEKLDNIPFKHTYEIKTQGMTYTFGLPQEFNACTNEKEVLKSCFRSITVKGKIILADDDKMIGKIPITVVNKVWKWFYEQEQLLKGTDLLNIQSPHSKEGIINFFSSFTDDSLLKFITGIYLDNLTSIYMAEYYLIQHLNFSMEDFKLITPAEVAIYNSIENKKDETPKGLPSKTSI